MEMINNLLASMTSTFGGFVPRLIGGLILLIVVWIIANVIKRAIGALGQNTNLDGRLRSAGITATFANVGYWLAWLIALPMVLGAFNLGGNMLEPITSLGSQIMGFLPKLIGAAVILGVGYLIAKVVRQIVTSLLVAAGSERLADRLGMSASLGKDGLAGLAGTLLFVLILLPVAAGALQPLGLDSVTRPVSNMLETIMNLIPKLIGAGIVMAFAVIVGRVIANLVTGLLSGLGVNKLPARLGMGDKFQIAGRQPAELIGTLVLAGIVLAALTTASEMLGLGVLTNAIATFGAIAAKVFSGLIVLGIGLWLSNMAAAAVKGSTLTNAKTMANIARGAVLFFVVPMALSQMGLPTEIVSVAFGSLMGALVIAAAIAFGIGGREAAGRIAERALKSLE